MFLQPAPPPQPPVAPPAVEEAWMLPAPQPVPMKPLPRFLRWEVNTVRPAPQKGTLRQVGEGLLLLGLYAAARGVPEEHPAHRGPAPLLPLGGHATWVSRPVNWDMLVSERQVPVSRP